MRYELKIEKSIDEKGTIDLQRLSTIADSIRKISEGALQIRLKGVSKSKGAVKLNEALKVSLTRIKRGSTILCLEAEKFEYTLPGYQTDLFRINYQQNLPQKTPISLVVESFQEALRNPNESDFLDKPLLKELLKLKNSFNSEEEIFSISNEGSFPELIIRKSDFKRIQIAEEDIPKSEFTVVNGIVEELKYSTLKVKIKTSEGIVDAFLSDNFKPEDIKDWWGKEATIGGTVHFKPGKKSVIEIERIFEASSGDDFFSKRPKHENLEQQIERQLQEGKENNPLTIIVGSWPGEETDEEFEELLKNLD